MANPRLTKSPALGRALSCGKGRRGFPLLSGPPARRRRPSAKHSLYLFIDELEKERVRVREPKLIASGQDLDQIPSVNELLFWKEQIFLFATHSHHVL